ncbi:Dbl homology domain-containing protein [Thamnocephalis sphaerospora]|uniref:Dbl homology domain-containing protein n=1 Tax=Thamnocephalis sphaerospora TaxID=78915 RepID=A0A4P9XKG6_9FUNG|nr:Dbl homology domain-containing protein [Thamnocephalis sphaerospora]|eukprot:RKP06297.1 Dbl homology domain-containing protein [Thamnocephalis sphaerospora]
MQLMQLMAMRPAEATPRTPAKGGSWATMVDRDVFLRASETERRRQEAIYELIATEEVYAADVDAVDQVFRKPIKKLIGRNEIDAVFGNWETIRRTTDRFMHSLRKRQWQGRFHVATIGDLFVEQMPMLECYISYCANQMDATTRLRALRETDPRLNHWLQRRQADSRCRNLDLASFLLQPMQRVTRYALLLRQIAGHTPVKHADYDSIRKAVDLAEDLLRRTNEAARDRADFTRLKEIAASLIMDSSAQQLDLTGCTRFLGQRRFVMEGVWIKGRQGRRLHAFLFTDLLLLCEAARSQPGMFKPYLDPISLSELEVRDTNGTRSLLRLEDVTFQIVHRKRSLTAKLENASVKRKWVQTLRECIARYRQAEHASEGGWLHAAKTRSFGQQAASVYCSVSLNQRQTYRTAVVTSSADASLVCWEQAFLFTITDLDDALRVAIYTYDRFSSDACLGYCEIDLRFLEFLDERGDERVVLRLQHGRPQTAPAPAAGPALGQAYSATPALPHSVPTPASEEAGTSANDAEPKQAPPAVVLALSYRKGP